MSAALRLAVAPVEQLDPNQPVLGEVGYWLLGFACWLAVNMLAAAGLLLGLFILMANANIDAVFIELANLANHYVAADAVRRAEFARVLAMLFAGTVLFFCAARYSAFPLAGAPRGEGLHA